MDSRSLTSLGVELAPAQAAGPNARRRRPGRTEFTPVAGQLPAASSAKPMKITI